MIPYECSPTLIRTRPYKPRVGPHNKRSAPSSDPPTKHAVVAAAALAGRHHDTEHQHYVCPGVIMDRLSVIKITESEWTTACAA